MAYPDTKMYYSKMQIGDKTYYIKDAEAKAVIDQLKAAAYKDVAAGVSANEQGLVTGAQVQAAIAGLASAMHFRGVFDSLDEVTNPQDGDVAIVKVKEYVYANDEWKELGDESIYVPKTTTVAGIALTDNISVKALQEALGLGALAYKDSASGTVAGQTISGVKATGTSTGSIAVKLDQTVTEATLAKGDYTPEGDVTGTVTATGTVAIAKSENGTQISGSVSAPDITVTPATDAIKKVTSVGTQASYTEGAFNQGSLPTYTQGAKAAWSASVDDATETLTFSFTANGDDTFTAGTLPSKAADTFKANELPTLAETATTVVTGITSAKASAPVFTGDKFGATFTGNQSGDAISAVFAGTTKADALVTGVSYDKASVNAENTKFTGAAITLDVGDITVATKEVTVE